MKNLIVLFALTGLALTAHAQTVTNTFGVPDMDAWLFRGDGQSNYATRIYLPQPETIKQVGVYMHAIGAGQPVRIAIWRDGGDSIRTPGELIAQSEIMTLPPENPEPTAPFMLHDIVTPPLASGWYWVGIHGESIGDSTNLVHTAIGVTGSGTTFMEKDGWWQWTSRAFSLVVIGNLQAAPILGRVRLAWDPSPSQEVATYRLYYGFASRQYVTNYPVGNVNTATVTNLDVTLLTYFTVTAEDAQGNQSVFSNEVSAFPSTTKVIDPAANLREDPIIDDQN